MAELGRAALIVALGLVLYATVAGGWAAHRRLRRLAVSAQNALLAAFAILALSSLSKSRRFVAIMYAGIVFFTAAMYQVLRGITTSRSWAVISPGEMLDVIAGAIFRSRDVPAVPVYVAVIVVFVIIGLAILILERRIRAVEVVA